MATVLEQLSRQTKLNVITQLNVAKSSVTELGPYVAHATADEALSSLLRGTDLWYTWQDDSTLTLLRLPWFDETSAKEASDAIGAIGGVYYETDLCGDLPVGPVSTDEPILSEAFWIELIKPHCQVLWKRISDKPGSIEGVTTAGHTKHNFAVDRMPRVDALNRIREQAGEIVLGYIPTDEAESQALVGPIQGRMSVNRALSLVMRGSQLSTRWIDDNAASMESAYAVRAYANMRICPCNFGLPELWPLESREVTVERSRLPSLDEQVAAPVFVGDREWIASTGATTIPELFRDIPQFAFHRGAGFRLSGAQFLEGGRGLGPEYTLVLINGRRAFGSAADPMVSAFDLNSVPLPAVDRIEVSFDQPSPAHGTDAIGGTINIVLRQDSDGISADAFLGSAEGGATQRRGTLSAGHDWGRIQGGAVIDYFTTSELLGADRDRWSDQNFTRYGASDQRSRFAAPPNVRAIRGNLPGVDSPSAAIILDESGVRIDTTTQNLTSLRAFQAIVPASERTSLYGFASAELGQDTTLRAETLLGRRRVETQLMPTLIPGLVWGATHPQNPFHQDVLLDVALTGLPIQTYNTDSDLARVVTELSTSRADWNFNVFGLMQRDESDTRLSNAPNMLAIMNSLRASDATALPVASSSPGHGVDASAFLAPNRIDVFTTKSQQLGASLSGPVARLAADDVTTEIGLEHRRESALFDPQVRTVSRDVDAAFATIRMPLVGKRLDLSVGARHDSYSDAQEVTRPTFGLTWRPSSEVSIVANASKMSRPPSLFELHRRRIAAPTQIFDPTSGTLVPVSIVFGGNKDLDPSEGSSRSLSIEWAQPQGWKASASLWHLEVRDRVSAPSAPVLLATDGDLARDRISRDATGRLISIDLSYANFGTAITRGLDLSVERHVDTRIGSFGVRLDVTHALSFDYSDLPMKDAPVKDKVGRASIDGTIPADRAVLRFSYSREAWRGELFARFHSSIDDYLIGANTPTGRNISSQTLIDTNVSRTFKGMHEVSLGIENVLDDEPPFAEGWGDYGYDLSQGDLVGRVAYLKWSASF